ncbi:MAG: hypothetical protein IJ335_12085 [Lachnospiraceae bacterium]|nr:hypothetical protein [Lachnospiraceae bacterium]
MKKEELRESLDRIRPSEELIDATMQKIKEQQEVRQRAKVPFWSTTNYRWVSAVATCALVLGVGLVAWRQTGRNVAQDGTTDNQEYRLAEEIGLYSDTETTENELVTGVEASMTESQSATEDQSAFSQMDTSYEQWALLRGTILSCRFLEVSPEDATRGMKPQAILEFDLQEVLDRTEQWATEDEDTICVLADFVDEKLNELINSMGSDISIQIIPIENKEEAVWKITDYFIE